MSASPEQNLVRSVKGNRLGCSTAADWEPSCWKVGWRKGHECSGRDKVEPEPALPPYSKEKSSASWALVGRMLPSV